MSTLLPPRRWTPSVRQHLDDLIRRPEPGLAALDWDETCIRGDISYALLDDLDEESDRDLWADYRARCELDLLAAYEELALWLVAGRRPEEVGAWTRRVTRSGLDSGSSPGSRRSPTSSERCTPLAGKSGW